jgi:hypothetical protein
VEILVTIGCCFFSVAVGTMSSFAAPGMASDPIEQRCALLCTMFLSFRSVSLMSSLLLLAEAVVVEASAMENDDDDCNDEEVMDA